MSTSKTKAIIIYCIAVGVATSLGVAAGIDMCNKIWRKRLTEVLDKYSAPKQYSYDPLDMEE